jgi:DEAD/DEAH box helicase domain-containing protein
MDACDALDALADDPELAGASYTARCCPSARPVRRSDDTATRGVRQRIEARGIGRLYAHQAEAINRLRGGESVVVATGTASGKSLCYQVPIVESVVVDRRDTALLIFPTKALAHDQLRALRSWLVPGLRAVTFDGDTDTDDRKWARKNANVVLTNPDMLHVGILPSHQRWATFFMRLRYVVVDELHTLRGIFGSHVAHVLRRLRRMCEHYGAHPTFCFASATIGNPDVLASELCGLPVLPIDDDASPRSERVLACWQRPLLDEHSGARGSANVETAELLSRFVRTGHPTLAFTRSRRGAELVAQHARSKLEHVQAGLGERVAAYRAGYLASERREIELDLTSGRLLGVAATNALELGIDVGGLDAVVLNGFPGTLASMWQQAGRAGRTERRAVAVLVAGDDQLDQWYAPSRRAHESRARARGREPAEPVRAARAGGVRGARAAAAHPSDDAGSATGSTMRARARQDASDATRRAHVLGGESPAAPEVGLRSDRRSSTALDVDEGHGSAPSTTPCFAVGIPAAVTSTRPAVPRRRLDTRDHVALLAVRRPTSTPAAHRDRHRDRRRRRVAPLGARPVHLGAVEVRNHVIAYQRKQISTNRVIEVCDLELPERKLVTRACWYTVPPRRSSGRASRRAGCSERCTPPSTA